MKLYSVLLTLILLFVICPETFSQKCKEGLPRGSGRGPSKLIKRKPDPGYTEEARRRQIVGTVVLRALFHSSGQVRDVCWIQGLPYGLTERAIAAAYRIEFTPRIKDGRAVSVSLLVEYNFNLY